MSELLLIRADAGPNLGAGHLLRCLALAQQWRTAGGKVVFLSRCAIPALRQRIRTEGYDVEDVPQAHPYPSDLARTLDIAKAAAWVVLDGYHFDSNYQAALQKGGAQTLILDDNSHLSEYHADILLNMNIGAVGMQYPCAPDTVLLTGLRYALLRQEFLQHMPQSRDFISGTGRVLVSLGGGAPIQATRLVLEALLALGRDGLDVVATCGMAGNLAEELRPLLDASPSNFRLLEATSDMPQLMAWADLAVVSAGSTCWEAAYSGLPLVLGVLAENQENNARLLARSGLAINLGAWGDCSAHDVLQTVTKLLNDAPARQAMAAAARLQVDGRGALRVVRLMRALGSGGLNMPGELRPALAADCAGVWRIANDPAVRTASFSAQPIPWGRHCEWFADKLASANSLLFVLDAEGFVGGYIRYDKTPSGDATISFAVAPAFRGRGAACRMIRETWRNAAQALGCSCVNAFALEDNAASHACFNREGFAICGTTIEQGRRALKFERALDKEGRT